MKRILLLGANGQVGFELARVLPPLGDLVCATRDGRRTSCACEAVDLGDAAALKRVLDTTQPDLVVNAAAYTAVDRAEDEPQLATRINAEAVGEIGAWAAQRDAAVVHYSTDYIFAGDGNQPWREDDATDPLGAYGRSKLAGEQALLDSGCRHLVFRTAWVYAARGHNFLLTMLRLARQRDVLKVVSDQIGCPTPAALIAAATAAVLARWLDLPGDAQQSRAGTYHLACAGHCSWHEFASAIIERAHAAGLLPRAVPIESIAGADFPTRAARPSWSVLDTSRLRETFGVALPPWSRGLDLVLTDLAAVASKEPASQC